MDKVVSVLGGKHALCETLNCKRQSNLPSWFYCYIVYAGVCSPSSLSDLCPAAMLFMAHWTHWKQFKENDTAELAANNTDWHAKHHPPVHKVVGGALAGSERSVEAVSIGSSTPVVSIYRGTAIAERSPPVCKGELHGVSSSAVVWINTPSLFAVRSISKSSDLIRYRE